MRAAAWSRISGWAHGTSGIFTRWLLIFFSTRHSVRATAEDGRWPKHFLRVFWAFAILWLFFLIPYELPRVGDALIARFDWYPLYLPMVAIIYYLGVKGYFISYRREPDKKAGVAVPEEKVGPLTHLLKRSMEEERLWLQADLNLSRLAQHCGAAPKLLSTVLNQNMDITCNDFVNGYRVDEPSLRNQGV